MEISSSSWRRVWRKRRKHTQTDKDDCWIWKVEHLTRLVELIDLSSSSVVRILVDLIRRRKQVVSFADVESSRLSDGMGVPRSVGRKTEREVKVVAEHSPEEVSEGLLMERRGEERARAHPVAKQIMSTFEESISVPSENTMIPSGVMRDIRGQTSTSFVQAADPSGYTSEGDERVDWKILDLGESGGEAMFSRARSRQISPPWGSLIRRRNESKRQWEKESDAF